MNPKNPCPQIRATVQYVDPEWAQKLLATNPTHQRSISTANLRKIEGSLKDDNFVVNGQTIVTDEDGKLMDGQHRCQASVNTGIGFWTVFVSNVPKEYFKYMDNGKARSFNDVLKTTGKLSSTNMSSTVARLAEYLIDPALVGTQKVFAHSQLLDVIEMSPNIDRSVREVDKAKHIVPPSRAAWMHYVLHQVMPDDTEAFFSSISSGEMLSKTDAVFQFRSRILNDKARGFHPPLREQVALLIKTWNSYIERKPVRILRWGDAEDFPVLLVPGKKGVKAA